MYIGHVFLCDAGSLKECIKHKAFSCTSDDVKIVREIDAGSTVFLFNMDADTVVGPFTATGSTGPGLEQGSWKEITDTNSKSNVRVEWEDLHELKNDREKFSFLKDLEICKLSHFQTQELMDALKNAPLLYIK